MKRKPVQSSMMSSLGYDPKTLTLEIEFISGDVWQYDDVEKEVYLEMINSDSLGKFFNERISGFYWEIKVR